MASPLTRRSFLAATSAAVGLSALSARRTLGAAERIRLGIIGTGDRGKYLMSAVHKVAANVGGVEWAAVSDIWDQRREEGAAATRTSGVRAYADYRDLLHRDDLDAVIIATPDHHHAHLTIEAVRAGKDVYVEKPMTSRPEQGAEVVQAVRASDRIVQVGMQQRSMANFQEARRRIVAPGLLGKVHMVRTLWNGNSGYVTIPPPGMERKPAGLDWDAWLGPLPRIPWDPKRYFNRFAYWDVSTGGQTGGLFVHMVDVVHWFLDNHQPLAAVAGGGIYQYDDGRDTPDNINLILEYPDHLNVTFEASLTDLGAADIVFMGTGGRLSIFRGGYTYEPAEANKAVGKLTGGWTPEEAHMENWLACVKSRQTPNADATAGYYSSMACHIGNLAYQRKARVEWQPEWSLPKA